MLSEELKIATLPAHRAIESVELFRRLMQNDFRETEYLLLLQLWQQFIGHLETKLLQIDGLEIVFPDLEQRLKGPLIAADLKALGFIPNKQKLAVPNLPACQTIAEALGILYVLEGSSLGAQFIIKQLQQHEFIDANNTTFYKGYGPKTGKMWKAFKQQIDAWGTTHPADQKAVVASALRCFDLLGKGMQPPTSGEF